MKFYIENDKPGVFQFIEKQHLDVVNHHLFAYLATNLNLNNQQAEKAEQIILGKNNSAAFMPTPVWDMEMGYAKIHHLDPAAALYLERFIASFKGKFYVKDVLKMRPLLVSLGYPPEQVTQRGVDNVSNMISHGFDCISINPSPQICLAFSSTTRILSGKISTPSQLNLFRIEVQ